MKGCRPLSEEEGKLVMSRLGSSRDRAIFALGRYTGERISAILKLKRKNIQIGSVTYERSSRKGKTEGRTVTLHPAASQALQEFFLEVGSGGPEDYLFTGRKNTGEPISRVQFHRILKEACRGLEGPVATHSMRKTFANQVYQALGENIFKTQQAMGHKNINSTSAYLSFRQEDIDRAILAA